MPRQSETHRRDPDFLVGLPEATSSDAKRLKTIGLHNNLPLILKLSQANSRGGCRVVKRHQSDTGVSILEC